MKKTILIISSLILLSFMGFEVYEIHTIKSVLASDQEVISVGAQGSVNTWNYIVENNKASSATKK